MIMIIIPIPKNNQVAQCKVSTKYDSIQLHIILTDMDYTVHIVNQLNKPKLMCIRMKDIICV